MKTLVIFDIDGTLLHSNKIDSQCFAETYEVQFGKAFPTIDWTKYPHVTDHTIFGEVIKQHFGRAATIEDIQKQQTHFVNLLEEKRQSSPEAFMEVPGAIQAVRSLQEDSDYLVGIATGGWQAPAQVKLKHLNFPMDDCFDSYADNKVTREDILSESIEKARAVHADIERIVYVGDAIWDVKTTRNMGLNFIGLRLRGDFTVLQSAGANIVLKDYLDYNFFLESIQIAEPPK